MEKILLIISILSIIFLAGCGGLFNLGGWICPDDLEFIMLIEELDTPQIISDYMIANFKYEAHRIYTPSPYILWKTEKGDCNDFSTFGSWVAHRHGYETYQIETFYNDSSNQHCIAVYVENDGLSFSDNQYYSLYCGQTYFNTFKEIVEFDNQYVPELRKYIVYDYWNNEVERGYK